MKHIVECWCTYKTKTVRGVSLKGNNIRVTLEFHKRHPLFEHDFSKGDRLAITVKEAGVLVDAGEL